ncbi:MAG: hypothetical protein HY907_01850 [Deltaproteobacteria bacterium]|nr:hypothetical protein [Deltaproteobacteria bacterium]
MIAFAFAAVLLATVLIMARADALARRPVFGLATILLAAAGTVVALAVGLGALLAARRRPGDPARVTGTWSHVLRLGIALLVIGGAAIVARAALVPDSYGAYGYFRGDAVRDAMRERKPAHQGRAACAGCHEAEGALHGKDFHAGIQCESCHGAGGEHVASVAARAEGKAELVPVVIPRTQEPCLWCHRRLAARPSSFPQIDPEEHLRGFAVADLGTPCMRCHDPHEPLFLTRPLREARLHPVIQQCRDCHAGDVDTAAVRPEGHPVVFECRYCHGDIAADFAERTHRALPCGRCHQAHRESETATRIVRSHGPDFCLLCHRDFPLREPVGMPTVAWPAHPERNPENPPPPLPEDAPCVDCHMDRIHARGLATAAVPGGAP